MKTSIKVLRWTPRIICMLAILFISMFAVDAFSPKLAIWEQLLGFLIHLIPSLVLVVILVLSWKREIIGGIFFTVIGIALTPIIFTLNYKMNHSVGLSLGIVAMITLPFIVAGVLFALSYFYHKKNRQS